MTPIETAPHPKTFALFPGQGSQHVGMAKAFHENFGIVRQIFEEASEAIKVDLRKLCFDGPESDLVLTENTQPCLLTASIAAFRAAEAETGFRPAAVAGHSLGEYSALVAVGALPLATAVSWVRERGRAMQGAVPAGQGTMAAVLGLEDAAVEKLCAAASAEAKARRQENGDGEFTVPPTVEPANFNSPGQVVIAGSTDAVQAAVAMIKTGGDFTGGKAVLLSVSAPFHCSLMKPARDRMAELFSDAPKPTGLSVPYVPNRTGRVTQEGGVIYELLVEQIDHPVLWKQSVAHLLEAGFARAVEFGPGKVLTGLVKRIAQPTGKACALVNVSDPAALKDLR